MEERFNKKIDKTETCWNWLGLLDCGGYGRFSIGNGKWFKAHRVSYQLFKGEIPEGLVVRHQCNNRKCVNPEHLELGTQKDNIADMFRTNPPNRKGRSKRSDEQTILELRQWVEFGYTHQQIGDAFGYTQPHTTNIKNRKLWSHI